MDRKRPISFQARRKERRQQRTRAGTGGEFDEVVRYWQQFVRHPWSGSGRFFWTERMFWGNAILGGAVAMAAGILEAGLHPLLLVVLFINVFFLFVLVYYLLPWIVEWVLTRMKVFSVSVDQLKTELIALSGWLVVVSVVRFVPVPALYALALAFFTGLVSVRVHYSTRAGWLLSYGATILGMVAVVLVEFILSVL